MVIFLSMAFSFPVRDVEFPANDAVNLVIDFTPWNRNEGRPAAGSQK